MRQLDSKLDQFITNRITFQQKPDHLRKVSLQIPLKYKSNKQYLYLEFILIYFIFRISRFIIQNNGKNHLYHEIKSNFHILFFIKRCFENFVIFKYVKFIVSAATYATKVS